MKKLILLVMLAVLVFQSIVSYAVEPKHLVHNSAKDIEFKKKKALGWYQDNVTDRKFYADKSNLQIAQLKNKALRWSDKELKATKDKALKWYSKNSQ